MTTAPFPIDAELCAVTIAYRNKKLIADEVLPRVKVGKREFKYQSIPEGDFFTLPESLVGRKGAPNEIDFTATETESSVKDYGFDDPVPQDDIDNAPPGYDPKAHAVEGLSELLALDREKRVADLVFAAAQYPTGNKATLSGTSQWSDFTNSNPVTAIMAALDAMMMRATRMVIGRAAYTKLCQHPKVVGAVYKNSGTSGIVPRQAIADLFELDQVLVGEGWLNSAKKGQTASLARVWGKHCALLYIDPMANTQRGITFGLSAEYGTRIAGAMPDSKIGLRGGQRVRVGESLKELVVAGKCGYLFTDAVA